MLRSLHGELTPEFDPSILHLHTFSDLLKLTRRPVSRLPRANHISRWAQSLALVLAGVVLLQSGPIQSVVHSIQSVQHECSCHRDGICPRNPDGPCTCDHHSAPADADSSEGPVFRVCHDTQSDAVRTVVTPKRVFNREARGPIPPVFTHRRPVEYDELSPQRVGDDVFHPPQQRGA